MEFHVITAAGADLIARKIDGQPLIIIPPAMAPTPAAAPAAQVPGK